VLPDEDLLNGGEDERGEEEGEGQVQHKGLEAGDLNLYHKIIKRKNGKQR
jgi:hypothetical protein